MKYQIYLNKETSMIVNDLAEKNGNKASTFIKRFLEGFMRIYSNTEKEIEKEIQANGIKQPKV